MHYRLAEQAGNTVTSAAIAMLQEAFAIVPPNAPRGVVLADQSDSPTNSDAALFACFTAFTHPRRLQIIRHLSAETDASLAELPARLSMSPLACFRHLAKLERRGLVRARRRRGRVTFVLTTGEGKAQQRVLGAVRDYLRTDER